MSRYRAPGLDSDGIESPAYTVDAGDDAVWDPLLAVRESGARFAALIGDGSPGRGLELRGLLAQGTAMVVATVELAAGAASYPALTPHVPAAFWYERAIHDLYGVLPDGHPRLDSLVLPSAVAANKLPCPGAPEHPDRVDPDEQALASHVMGAGLFSIPHGPVRSGVFESIEYVVETPGEDIPHVNVRPHYKHRGIEVRFEALPLMRAVLLAERTEGIASVAHAVAYCHAVESLTGTEVPPAAGLVRVVHAELERLANHLDVAMKLADAAGLAVAAARLGVHKERTLRLVSQLCGNRFGRGVVVPGGVHALPRVEPELVRSELAGLARGGVGRCGGVDEYRVVSGPAARHRPAERGFRARARADRPDRACERNRRGRAVGAPLRRLSDTGPPAGCNLLRG